MFPPQTFRPSAPQLSHHGEGGGGGGGHAPQQERVVRTSWVQTKHTFSKVNGEVPLDAVCEDCGISYNALRQCQTIPISVNTDVEVKRKAKPDLPKPIKEGAMRRTREDQGSDKENVE
jgi:hypothetical protein